MSIREIWTEFIPETAVNITQVEITDDQGTHYGYDLFCDHCDDWECTFVKEAEARTAAIEHVHDGPINV